MPEEIYRKSVPLFGGTQDIVSAFLRRPNLRRTSAFGAQSGNKRQFLLDFLIFPCII